MRPGLRLAALLLCAAAPACNDTPLDAPRTGAAPVLANPNLAVGVTVGEPVSYDAARGGTAFAGADRRGGGLQYRITFEGAANGLSASGANVVGQPQAPGVTWATIVATDALGRTASDRFAVVAFAPGLATPTLPATPFRYADAALLLPAHFRAIIDSASVAATDNTPADNPVTDAGAALGRVLFYDMRVSASDGLSCGGCHSQSIGFSDTPQRSVGFAGGLTGRHSPALVNARFYLHGRFFWDERAATLEEQVLRPIQDGTEMGMTLDNLVAKIEATPYYAPLFTAAFGSPSITSDRVSRALAQYVRSLVSTGSRYDRGFTAAGTPNFAAVFTAQELEGEQLFRSSGCSGCHTTVSQVSDGVHNIGLDAVSADTGAGHGAFKAPSLRNVAVRPRFMHDGRFTALEDVVAFYNSGVQPNPDLDPRLKAADGTPKRLGLTLAQRAALVAFLRTLTDSAFLTAPRFANPFAPATVAPPPVTPAPSATVTIQATAYHPATLTVARGTVVTWTNLDNARHSASFASAAVGATPIFTSGSRQLTMPTTPGTYTYQCAVHGAQMHGTVIVQ
jgi:cytochrome c peroxidase